jgi:hypothetical protein
MRMRCEKGHDLGSLYFFQKRPRSMKTIKGFAYCPECNKIYKLEEI